MICKVEGCENSTYCRGYCTKHYSSYRRCGKLVNVTMTGVTDLDFIIKNRTKLDKETGCLKWVGLHHKIKNKKISNN